MLPSTLPLTRRVSYLPDSESSQLLCAIIPAGLYHPGSQIFIFFPSSSTSKMRTLTP